MRCITHRSCIVHVSINSFATLCLLERLHQAVSAGSLLKADFFLH